MTDGHILIVEDEAIVAKSIENTLGMLGYTVTATASSAAEAIQHAATTQPDLVLMDIRLRGEMDGIAAAEQIRARFDIPVIYLTAYTDQTTLQRAKVTEPFGYIVKPFEEGELHSAIEMALYKYRVEKKLRESERFLALLNDITRAALETPDLQTMLQTFADRLTEPFDADGCYLTLWDETTQTTIPAAACREMREIYPSMRPEPDEVTVTSTVLQTERPLVVEDVFDSPYINPRTIELFPDRSLLGLPLIADGQKLGAVLIAFNEPHTFAPDEVARGEQAAGQVALAVAKARLLEETQQRVAELQTLQHTSLQLTSSLDLPTVLDGIAESALSLVGASNCHIYLYDEASETLTFGTALWQDGRREAAVKAPRRAGLTMTVVRKERVVVVNDAVHHPLYASVEAHGWGVQAIAGFPLQRARRTLGVFTITFLEPHTFSEDELRVLSLLADQAAIAIENARLVEGLEAQVQARTAEIVAEKEKSEAILRSVGEAIVLADLEVRARYVNKAFTDLTGYTAEEALGELIQFLAAKPVPEHIRQNRLLTAARGETWRGEQAIRCKDGRFVDVALTIAPVYDAPGHLVGYVASMRDISQRKALERAQRRFMTNVSHQLRTPVANLKLYADLLETGRRPEKTEYYARVLAEQSEQLNHLITDILQITELDSGQAVTAWEPVSLPVVIQDTLTRYQSLAEDYDVNLMALPVPPDLPNVKGDPMRLIQALNELVENAIIFTPAGGRVTVQVGTIEEAGVQWVAIAVCDTGPGITPEEKERVFDRFFRGSLAESGHVPGTGMGLCIAQEIVRAHGGRVTVDSQEGQGSTFTLWLRSTRDQSQVPREQERNPYPSPSRSTPTTSR